MGASRRYPFGAWVAGLLGVLGVALVAPRADARHLSGTIVGQTKQVVGSDGSRFAAWRAVNAPATSVLDVARHRVVSVADPSGCDAPGGIGAGALVFGCGGEPPGPLAAGWVRDLRTGLVRQAVPPQSNGLDFRAWVGVGRRWLRAEDQGYHVTQSVFFDRATGREYQGRSPFGLHRQPDLDRAGLVRTICSPLHAPAEEIQAGESSDAYATLLLHGRLALDAGPTMSPVRDTPRLVLEHCGSPRRTTLCTGRCLTPTFTSGLIVWTDGVDVKTYRLSDHRRRSYSFSAGAAVGVWRVADRLLVAVDDYEISEPFGLLTLHLVRLARLV
jgi:hypothetical protein